VESASDMGDVTLMSEAADTIEILRDLVSREYTRHQATIADRNRLRGKIMSKAIDNTVPPGNWGGYCQLHHQQMPCPSCTSAPQPIISPSTWQPPPPWQSPSPNPDPWFQYSPNLSPLPPQPLFGFRFIPSVCDHCFCQTFEAQELGGEKFAPDHQGCCNCGAQRAIVTQAPDVFVDD